MISQQRDLFNEILSRNIPDLQEAERTPQFIEQRIRHASILRERLLLDAILSDPTLLEAVLEFYSFTAQWILNALQEV